MNNDRELLQLAAKAVGIVISFGDEGVLYKLPGDRHWVGRWNPLTDDGDALRLMVSLDLSSIMTFTDNGKYRDFWSPNSGYDNGKSTTTKIDYKNDPHAATRRAIVNAAAGIGRTMKEQ